MRIVSRWTFWLIAGLLQIVGMANAQGGSSLFADDNLKWESGPPELGYQTAVGAVTLFRENGELLRLSCGLHRDSEKSPLAVELKSGYTVSVGRWRPLADRKIEVKLRLVAVQKIATPINKPQPLPGDERTEVWTINDGDSPSNARTLAMTQGEQRRLLSLKNRSEFDRLVKCYLR